MSLNTKKTSPKKEISEDDIFDLLGSEFKQKELPKEEDLVKNKGKSLFDHINNVLTSRDPRYFDKLSDLDKKTWTNYMVHRFISMVPEYLNIVNEFQKYSKIPSNILSRLYIEVLPRKKIFYKYVKSKKSEKYGEDVIECIKKYYICSTKEALEYLDILTENDIILILKKFGITKKEK